MHKPAPALPREIILHSGQHLLTRKTRIRAAALWAELIRAALARAELPLAGAAKSGDGVITAGLIDDARLGGTGYRLRITASTVELYAPAEAGLRRAVETLRLLMHAQTGTFSELQGWQLPCVEVTDLGTG